MPMQTPGDRGGFDWLDSITQETTLLQRLAEASRLSRVAASAPGNRQWGEFLAEEAGLCRQLEASRVLRDRQLATIDRGAGDFLQVVLSRVPPAEHEAVVAAFSRCMDAAGQARREIEINREFFNSAATAIHETLLALAEDAEPVGMYGIGAKRNDEISKVCLFTIA